MQTNIQKIPGEIQEAVGSSNAQNSNSQEQAAPFVNQPVVNVVHQPIVNAPVTHVSPMSGTGQLDLWEVGGDPTLPNMPMADATILNVYELRRKQRRPMLRYILVIILGTFAALGTYVKIDSGKWPYEDAIVAGLRKTPEISESMVAGTTKAPTQVVKKGDISKPEDTKQMRQEIDGQAPYSLLPNFVTVSNKSMQRGWTKKEEENYTASMAQKYFYQRYKTVEDIRGQKLAGSERILQSAVTEKRLWIRMHAIMGLAEFGLMPQLAQVKLALGQSRKATITNFVKRYERSGLTVGERFALRAILPHIHDSARLASLKALELNRDELFGYYLYAARNDSVENIRDWANSVDMPKDFSRDRQVEVQKNISSGKAVKFANGLFQFDSKSAAPSNEQSAPENSNTVVQFYDYED